MTCRSSSTARASRHSRISSGRSGRASARFRSLVMAPPVSLTIARARSSQSWSRRPSVRAPRTAAAGAGFALRGASVTRDIDLARERGAEAALADASRRRDLDETRRLAYAALLSPGVSRDPVLVATIVNALAHHGLAVDPDLAAAHITNAQI